MAVLKIRQADGSSLTVYKTSEPTGGVSCKVGVTGAGVGANAVVTKVKQ